MDKITDHIYQVISHENSLKTKTKPQILSLKSALLEFIFQLSIQDYGRQLLFQKLNPIKYVLSK